MGYGYNQTLGSFPLDTTELLEEMLEAFGVEIGMITGAAAISGIILIIVGLLLLAMLVIAVITAILQCVAVYSIAKRRGIGHAWLAWIPVGNLWTLGSISDQYQDLVKSRISGRKKVLPGLYGAILAVMLASNLFAILSLPLPGLSDGYVMIFGIIAVFIEFISVLVACVAVYFHFVVIFDLYRSSVPKWAVLFLILSVLIPVSQAVFFLMCMKKDDGFPENADQLFEVYQRKNVKRIKV